MNDSFSVFLRILSPEPVLPMHAPGPQRRYVVSSSFADSCRLPDDKRVSAMELGYRQNASVAKKVTPHPCMVRCVQ